MGFYFLIFLILAIFSILEIYGIAKQINIFFFTILCFLLFILSFIRWETGTDWDNYFSFFNSSIQWGVESDFEWGFARINEFVNIFFNNYTVLLFFLGAIIFLFQSSSIFKFSPYPITSLLFLWSTTFANVFFVRQSIATVILFFSIKFIQEKKLFKFILMVALAMLFHRTSLIFILAWWVYPLKLRPYIMLLVIAFSLIITVFLSKLIMNLGDVIGGVMQNKIEIYIDSSSETFGTEASLAQIIIKGFANKIFIFVLSLFFLLKIEKKNKEFRGYLNLYWVGIIIYFSTISISIALVRLSFSYDMTLIILAPLMLKNIGQHYLRFSLFFIFICYLLLRLYISLVGGYYDLFVPFKTIFI